MQPHPCHSMPSRESLVRYSCQHSFSLLQGLWGLLRITMSQFLCWSLKLLRWMKSSVLHWGNQKSKRHSIKTRPIHGYNSRSGPKLDVKLWHFIPDGSYHFIPERKPLPAVLSLLLMEEYVNDTDARQNNAALIDSGDSHTAITHSSTSQVWGQRVSAAIGMGRKHDYCPSLDQGCSHRISPGPDLKI